ncbi:MAG: hypothetical protein HUU57_06275 [Bdellovibrio sp.]|nr:hypothetical protein [Bdellovibrio sp.]
MKLTEIIKVVAQELGTSDLKEINKILKTEPAIKFRIAGKALGHFGFTGQIKSLSEEGVKAFMTNKVSLIRLNDIETFEKAKPRAERPVRAPKVEVSAAEPTKVVSKKSKASIKVTKDDLEDGDEDDFNSADISDGEFIPKKIKKGQSKVTGKSGSKFIPAFKK